MFGMSNEEMYRRIEHQLDFQKDTIRSYLEATIDVVGEQNRILAELRDALAHKLSSGEIEL